MDDLCKNKSAASIPSAVLRNFYKLCCIFVNFSITLLFPLRGSFITAVFFKGKC